MENQEIVVGTTSALKLKGECRGDAAVVLKVRTLV